MACLQIISLNFELIPTLLIGFTGAYGLMILWLAWGWLRIPRFSSENKAGVTPVSVLIAVRNEDETLPQLIRDLENQNYPRNQFEIILIDDHSETAVEKLACIRETQLERLKVVRLPAGKEGKKAALKEGASYSSSELFLFTDADCRLNPGWIRSLATFYELNHADLIIGLVDQVVGNTLLSHFFRLDFLSLIAAGAGSAGQNHPTLCNGANLAVKREIYLKKIRHLNFNQVSGDDVFLLHALKRDPNTRIEVLKSKDSLVLTEAPAGLKSFLSQRLRWASKSSSYRDVTTLIISFLVLIFNFMIAAAILGTMMGRLSIYILLIMESTKLLVDFCLLFPVLKFIRKGKSLFFLPLFQIIYPFYLSGVAFLSFFSPIRWKKRVH